MNPHRRALVVLVLVIALVMAIAQFAGVGALQPAAPSAGARAVTLATVRGGSVPDRGSSTLARSRVTAAAGETVRMSGTAALSVRAPRSKAVEVVCGIRYNRAANASWTLGAAYETVVLKRGTGSKTITISRSFVAPAADTYRSSMACHVAAPASGARVAARGTMNSQLGLPPGAATPIS